MHSGFYEEAQDWRLWLQRAVAGLPAQAQIMYGVAEWSIPHVHGADRGRRLAAAFAPRRPVLCRPSWRKTLELFPSEASTERRQWACRVGTFLHAPASMTSFAKLKPTLFASRGKRFVAVPSVPSPAVKKMRLATQQEPERQKVMARCSSDGLVCSLRRCRMALSARAPCRHKPSRCRCIRSTSLRPRRPSWRKTPENAEI